jgi:dihydroorotate dehydrogenase electron transfer subunit
VSHAPFARRLLTITGSERYGPYVLLRAADPDGPRPAAGQFTMLAAAEGWGAGTDGRPLLARAFSVARHAGGEAQYVLEDVGPGTRRLCELREGERMWALGPLGTPFTEPQGDRRALLVGGGIGIAPLMILSDELQTYTAILGFRDRERAFAAELIAGAQVATDDGSAGHHGPCTDLLSKELERDGAATVYACGPAPMLESVRSICAQLDIPAQLALEAGMACGFGACYGCVVPTRGGGYARVCVDGPVFDASMLERVVEPSGST